MVGWEIGDDGGQRRLLCAARNHVPGDVTPWELCAVDCLGICEYPSPVLTHTAVATHVPLRVAGRGGAGGGGACSGARSRGPAPKRTTRLKTAESTSDPNEVVSEFASYSHSHPISGVPVLVHELPWRSAVGLGLRATVTTKKRHF